MSLYDEDGIEGPWNKALKRHEHRCFGCGSIVTCGAGCPEEQFAETVCHRCLFADEVDEPKWGMFR